MWLVFCLSYFKKAIRIFLVIFVLGQGLIPLSKIYPFITLYRLLFYPIFLVWIIRLFSKKNRIIHTPLNGPILLFISIQVIAIIFSFDIGESVKRLPVNIEYYGLLFILISSISNKRDIKKIIGSWLALVFISFISAMYEIATRSNILAELHLVGTGEKWMRYGIFRAYGFFDQRIALGIFMVIIFPFIWYRYNPEPIANKVALKYSEKSALPYKANSARRLPNIRMDWGLMRFITIIVLVATLIFTLSTGPWLGFVAIILTLGGYKVIRRPVLIFVIMMIAVILIISIEFVPAGIYSYYYELLHFNKYAETTGANIMGRLSIVQRGLAATKQRPWLGYGPNVMWHYGREGILADQFGGSFQGIENNYILLLFESGIIGLIAYLCILYIILKEMAKFAKATPAHSSWRILAVGIIACVIGYGVIGLSAATIGFDSIHQMFLTLVALGFIGKRLYLLEGRPPFS